MKNILFVLGLLVCKLNAQDKLTRYVNPFIGTGGHGHTFPGATRPFAMVQLSPDTRIDGSWDGCSGYHYSDSLIYGFSHTHLSGTGCSDYGDLAFMPTHVSKPVQPIENIDTLFAWYSHKTEKARAGYYSVELNKGRIKVELTSTTRVGLQKYTYKYSGWAWITLNLKHRDQLLEGKIEQKDKHSFSGLRRSKAWAEDQLLYYYFEVSADPSEIRNDGTKIHLGFRVRAGESIMVKTALSGVDEEGAKNNLLQELPHWDFDKVVKESEAAWENELSRIKVYGGKEEEKIIFYTALYHCMIHPSIMNDVDGRYRSRDKQVHKAEGFDYYTVFSLWDTHRALHPLLNIIDKKRSHDFIRTFKAQYEQSGRLPMWELWGNETNCMIGFHSVSVILDAYKKGVITKEELNAMYPAVKAEAMSNRFGLDKFREKGYLEVGDESESVSKTLEYSYDMWCVSEIARLLDSSEDYKYFDRFSRSWMNLKDNRTGFVRPRKNGGWLEPFDPREVNNHFTEANAWQYSFYMPHYEQKNHSLLDSLFKTDSRTTGREQADITGLVGQYAHGNEPSHNTIYLLGKQNRVKYLDMVMKGFYKNSPDGLSGNEDCGQMSAWYVFSAMGFYPVNPASNKMPAGMMLFDSVTIGDKIRIKKDHTAKLNEVNLSFWDRSYLVSGRNLSISSLSRYRQAPFIFAGSQVFSDSLSISLVSGEAGPVIYSLDSGKSFHDYDSRYPLVIYKTTTIDALSIGANLDRVKTYGSRFEHSDTSTATFYKRPNNYAITLHSTYNKQYTADGDEGLLDGLKGDTDWRKGRWQGYQGQDFEAVVDLKKEIQVNAIYAGFLQDTRAWILMPSTVIFYGSADGVNFEEIKTLKNEVADTNMAVQRQELGVKSVGRVYRYIKVKAINYGKLPQWHPGKNEDAFVFIDEIRIE